MIWVSCPRISKILVVHKISLTLGPPPVALDASCCLMTLCFRSLNLVRRASAVLFAPNVVLSFSAICFHIYKKKYEKAWFVILIGSNYSKMANSFWYINFIILFSHHESIGASYFQLYICKWLCKGLCHILPWPKCST